MEERRLRTIAVVGGGVAGSMAAAALARLLKRSYCEVVLVTRPEASALAGGAALPALQRFHNLLGIDEDDFIRRTDATFSLGVEFRDWSRIGDRYFHTFCEFGGAIASVPFQHYWRKLRGLGDARDIGDYSVATALARLGRFARPVQDSRSVLSLHSHAFHFDNAFYADHLRSYAVARGASVVDGDVVGAEQRGSNGFIERLVLADGRRVEADFFIDCTDGLLIERVLGTGWEDWSGWLPCDRAVSLETAMGADIPVCTLAQARPLGWRRTLPLRTRFDHTFFYSSENLDDGAAADELVATAGGGEPRWMRFRNGRPRLFWNRNCLTLPGTVLEPLEASTIHMIQTGILKFVSIFPDRNIDPADADEYNRLTIMESERIRDLLILHYALTERADTAFWDRCRTMAIPDTLRHKIDLFAGSGRVNMLDNEHFGEQSWISVFLGQNLMPARYDPLADVPDTADVRRRLDGMAAAIAQAAQSLPTHRQYLSGVLKRATAA
jgi:tryptophan halogenase